MLAVSLLKVLEEQLPHEPFCCYCFHWKTTKAGNDVNNTLPSPPARQTCRLRPSQLLLQAPCGPAEPRPPPHNPVLTASSPHPEVSGGQQLQVSYCCYYYCCCCLVHYSGYTQIPWPTHRCGCSYFKTTTTNTVSAIECKAEVVQTPINPLQRR